MSSQTGSEAGRETVGVRGRETCSDISREMGGVTGRETGREMGEETGGRVVIWADRQKREEQTDELNMNRQKYWEGCTDGYRDRQMNNDTG